MARYRKIRKYVQKRSEEKNRINKLGSRKYEKPDIQICALIESRMNNLIDKINETDSIIEADPLDSELRILDWILYIVCSNA